MQRSNGFIRRCLASSRATSVTSKLLKIRMVKMSNVLRKKASKLQTRQMLSSRDYRLLTPLN